VGEYRVLITSDIHCTDLGDWYGVRNEDRMEHWLREIHREHEKHPFDLILIPGDISLDYHDNRTPFDKGYSTGYLFMKMYASRLPAGVPLLVTAGNHEQFPEETWRTITGNPRQCHAVVGNHTFVMLDGFREALLPTYDSTDAYSPWILPISGSFWTGTRTTICGCCPIGLRCRRRLRNSAAWWRRNSGSGAFSWATAMSIR